jgi:acyl-CoA thioesterase FadM
MIEQKSTIFEARPRFEGSNICSWIGFKHVMYLVEEAILAHFRDSGYVPRALFEEHGLCLEIVDSSVRILHALHMDDVARVEVKPNHKEGLDELQYRVAMFVHRNGEDVKALTGTVKVLFRRDTCEVTACGTAANVAPVDALAPFTVSQIQRCDEKLTRDLSKGRGVIDANDDLIRSIVPSNSNSFVWKWHIPYFYCHYTNRIQHSGYLRLMEEVVDLFLANRGISIWTMLQTRKWIPVVPSARLEILREAYMEETLYTVYTVEDIFKDTTYTSRMDCYAERSGALIHTATGRITHGYAVINNRKDWSLVGFDSETLAALKGIEIVDATKMP